MSAPPLEVDLSGKVAVVTGASRGIGKGVCETLVAVGATVFGSARSEVEVEGVASVPADLTTPQGPGQLVAAAVEATGRLDIVVNNVGGLAEPRFKGFTAISDEEWQLTLDANLMSAVRLCRAAVPHLIETQGSIVNISSIGAVKPEPALIDYAAAKAGLNAFAKALSAELGPHGVRVNTVSCGPILTPSWTDPGGMGDMLAEGMGLDPDTAIDELLNRLGGLSIARWGLPEEVGRAVLFLASDLAAFSTGADLYVDGGLYKGM